jgi:hypothetical protein
MFENPVTIAYSTECRSHRNKGGEVGKLDGPKEFASIGHAKSAPLPDGCTFARIQVPDGGYHVWSIMWGWNEFHEPTRA